MTSPQTPTGQFRFDPRNQRAIPAQEMWGRVIAMLVGVAICATALWWFYEHRKPGEDIALGDETHKFKASYEGARLNSYNALDAAEFYSSKAWTRTQHEGVWLGNSQIFAINQMREGDFVAPLHATKQLGWRVYGLNIPNANFQEYLVLQEWAFRQRSPDWVIMVAVFDDLRETGVRAELAELASPELLSTLRTSEIGAELADELDKASHSTIDTEGNTRITHHDWILAYSLQEICEAKLNDWLSSVWPLWRDRAQIRAGLAQRMAWLRNWVFNISNRTVRPVLASTYTRNMRAMTDALERNRARGVHTIVYIAPLRHDVAAPYQMDKYAQWKKEMEQLALDKGAYFHNLESIVPDELWGTDKWSDVDFMHYQGGAHQIVGNEIARIITSHLQDPPPSGAGTPGPAQHGGTR